MIMHDCVSVFLGLELLAEAGEVGDRLSSSFGGANLLELGEMRCR